MRYYVTHTTSYRYSHDVSVSHHIARLTPRARANQRCLEHDLRIDPSPALKTQREDYFGNAATFLTVEGAHRELMVEATSLVELTLPSAPSHAESASWETIRDLCREPVTLLARQASEFVYSSPMIQTHADYLAYAQESFAAGRPILEAVLELNGRIFADFKFDPKATSIATPLDLVFKTRRGVCQDFAHFQIACFRSIGIPARYVSGYLETHPPPGQRRLVGNDASHAWTQVWCAELGWVDVDPTNNLQPTDRHVTVAWGRDYDDVSPVRGVIVGGGEHQLRVAVDVVPMASGDRAPGAA